MKSVIISTLILIILSGSFSSANAEHRSGNGVGLAVGSIGFLALMIYDIATAPSSARHYNESFFCMFPLIPDRPVIRTTYTFGQPKFTRAALLNNSTLPETFTLGQTGEHKSPKAALHWSLGATLVPISVGIITEVVASEKRGDTTLEIFGGVLISTGSILGPSAGHFYSNKVGRGLLTSGLRIGFAVLALASSGL